MAEDRAGEGSGGPGVPWLLATVAAWCWRLIVIGIVVYGLFHVFGVLRLVVLPFVVALLLCALLYPFTEWLRGLGLPSLAATWSTMLLALAVLGGVGTYIGVQANAEFPKLVDQVRSTVHDIQHWLVHGPLHLEQSQLQSWANSLIEQIQQRRTELANAAIEAGTVALEFAAAIVLLLFITFFLLKDGPRVWQWSIGGLGRHRERFDRAGRVAWATLSQYVHGTVIVAAIHAVVIAIVLTVMRVPLVAPLAVIVFFGSFIPIVGILVAGSVAVIVVFSVKGGVAALVFIGVLVVENQLEGHVLQPLVVGRRVRFHPLAIIMALAVGVVLGGIPGAALAVPIAAVLYRAWPALRAPPEVSAPDASERPPERHAGEDEEEPEAGTASDRPDTGRSEPEDHD